MDCLKSIAVEFHLLDAPSFSTSLVSSVLDAAENAVFRAENDELDALQELLGLHETYFDATRYRLQLYRGQLLRIESAELGSLKFFAVVPITVALILNMTLEETITGAWKDSEAHAQLKSYLTEHIDEKVDAIGSYFRDWFSSSEADETAIRVEESEGQIKLIIEIRCTYSPDPALTPDWLWNAPANPPQDDGDATHDRLQQIIKNSPRRGLKGGERPG